MDRDELLAEAADLRSQVAAIAYNPFDVHEWDKGEEIRIRALSDEERHRELVAADAADAVEQKRVRTLQLLRQVNSERVGILGRQATQFRNEAAAQVPAVVNEAIANLTSEVEARRNAGRPANISYRQDGRGRMIPTWTGQTQRQLAATVRCESAIGKLEGLKNVGGDMGAKVRAILSDLHAADMADYDNTATEVAVPRVGGLTEAGLIFAEIEPGDAPRERLLPAG